MFARVVLSLVTFIALTACQTEPKFDQISSPHGYKKTFSLIRLDFSRCFPNAKFRNNLYTDIPLGEIILSELNGASVPILDGNTRASEKIRVTIDGRNRSGSLIKVSPPQLTEQISAALGGRSTCN